MSTGWRATLGESVRIMRPFWPLAAFATAAGGVSGIASAALLATVNRVVHSRGEAVFAVLATFAGLCAVSLGAELVSNIGGNLVGQRILAALRKELSRKVISTPLAEIERFQSHRLLVTLSQDVATIGAFTFTFPTIAIAFSIAAGCLGYLAMLSPLLFIVTIVAVALMFAAQAFASQIGLKKFGALRDAYDELQKHYRAIIEGAKEIRLNRPRRARVYDQLTVTIDQIANQYVAATRIHFGARAIDSALFYAALFAVLAVGTRAGSADAAVSGFVLVLLYVKGPIEQIVGALPLLAEAHVSFRRVAELSAAITAGGSGSVVAHAPPARSRVGAIELREACYEFPARDAGEPFVLGPLNLTLNPGEMLFIVGVNGCGKTTLLKLLAGLYAPRRGELRWDGNPLEASQLDDYRQMFSAVFCDSYLFDELMLADPSVLPELDRHLERLNVAEKVAIRDGKFSTTELSTGQRKRLALIHVFAERRPIVVLDEWAADQDPEFRRVFYEELLPDMKRQGKTLIVVSHDDRYFHLADRVVEIEGGRIVQRPSGAGSATSTVVRGGAVDRSSLRQINAPRLIPDNERPA